MVSDCELAINTLSDNEWLTVVDDHLFGAFPAFALIVGAPDRRLGLCDLLVASGTGHLALEACHVPENHALV